MSSRRGNVWISDVEPSAQVRLVVLRDDAERCLWTLGDVQRLAALRLQLHRCAASAAEHHLAVLGALARQEDSLHGGDGVRQDRAHRDHDSRLLAVLAVAARMKSDVVDLARHRPQIAALEIALRQGVLERHGFVENPARQHAHHLLATIRNLLICFT